MGVWKLQDAKARFSEVVRLARGGEPQRVTVHGEDAVVIVSAADFEKKQVSRNGEDFVAALRSVTFDEPVEFMDRSDMPALPRDVALPDD